jgi:integrase
MPKPQKKLLDQLREVIRRKHYSASTAAAYVRWCRRYILFHNKRHPQDMGKMELEAFLSHLAIEGQVGASTQNQALNAVVFLYRHVLEMEFDFPLDAIRAKRPKRLPVVLTKAEVREVLAALEGVYLVMAQILYGSGLRVGECVRLRVKDLDFGHRQIIVRDGKGGQDVGGERPQQSHQRRQYSIPLLGVSVIQHLPPLNQRIRVDAGDNCPATGEEDDVHGNVHPCHRPVNRPSGKEQGQRRDEANHDYGSQPHPGSDAPA